MSTRLSSRRTVAHVGRPVGHRLRRAGERAVLRDGSDVLIRPVRHDDAALLSRRLRPVERAVSPVPVPDDEELPDFLNYPRR